MAGITNAPFRLLMREYGAGAVVSELISATGIQYAGEKTLALCRYFDGERPVGLQIFGEDKEHLALSAQFLEKRGVDFIDINFGCPVPKIVQKGAGAAMLKNPNDFFQVVQHVRRAIRIPLTVKIRTGWDSCTINASEIVHAAAEAGVAWVTIHGRTRAQGYEGEADWELMAKVKEKSPIPIIGNGDILTAEHALSRLRSSGCDAVMIGRGALRNPFVFLEISALQLGQSADELSHDYWKLILRHIELLRSCYTENFIGIQLRKFLTWYSAGIEGASQLRKKLYEVPIDSGSTPVIELARSFFDRPGLKTCSSFLKEPFLRGGHG